MKNFYLFFLGLFLGCLATFLILTKLAYTEMYQSHLLGVSRIVRAMTELHLEGDKEKETEFLKDMLELNISSLHEEKGTSVYRKTNQSIEREFELSQDFLRQLQHREQ